MTASLSATCIFHTTRMLSCLTLVTLPASFFSGHFSAVLASFIVLSCYIRCGPHPPTIDEVFGRGVVAAVLWVLSAILLVRVGMEARPVSSVHEILRGFLAFIYVCLACLAVVNGLLFRFCLTNALVALAGSGGGDLESGEDDEPIEMLPDNGYQEGVLYTPGNHSGTSVAVIRNTVLGPVQVGVPLSAPTTPTQMPSESSGPAAVATDANSPGNSAFPCSDSAVDQAAAASRSAARPQLHEDIFDTMEIGDGGDDSRALIYSETHGDHRDARNEANSNLAGNVFHRENATPQ